ncbi:hypothetical protein [Methylocella silvestris]|uniref:hypothetical protein n=1 Tax=Methylocella silvestris TaxID=199596 RepID=UPI000172455C|nr:hypothetical protein [Methylocella silvestris]
MRVPLFKLNLNPAEREAPNTLKAIKHSVLAAVAVIALGFTANAAQAQDYSAVNANGTLKLGGYGNFFIAGNLAACPAPPAPYANSDICSRTVNPGLRMINQMYVQFMLPIKEAKKAHWPIAIVHGCCLSTKSWQTTPDGRMGWDEYFVRQKFDTYMVDQVGRARSGFDAISYNSLRYGITNCIPSANPAAQCPAIPSILIASDQFAWNVFRWGTTTCTTSPCSSNTVPNAGIRFPMQTVGVGPGSNLQFYNMVIPDLNATLSGAPSPTDPAGFYNTPAQMAELARQLGGATLMGHSESSSFPIRAALQPAAGCYPWTTKDACKVKAIIQLETGCFGNLTAEEIKTLKHIPILIEEGDFYPTARPVAPCPQMIQQITAAGGDIKYAHLPDLKPNSLYRGSPGAIHGNDHMVMLDTNNLQIAQIFINWLSSRGL